MRQWRDVGLNSNCWPRSTGEGEHWCFWRIFWTTFLWPLRCWRKRLGSMFMVFRWSGAPHVGQSFGKLGGATSVELFCFAAQIRFRSGRITAIYTPHHATTWGAKVFADKRIVFSNTYWPTCLPDTFDVFFEPRKASFFVLCSVRNFPSTSLTLYTLYRLCIFILFFSSRFVSWCLRYLDEKTAGPMRCLPRQTRGYSTIQSVMLLAPCAQTWFNINMEVLQNGKSDHKQR